MKIGYALEGSTDRALIFGLRNRWCPEAELMEGAFRGSTGLSLRREYKKICEELVIKGADVLVFLTDANNENWRTRQKSERDHFPQERLYQAIHGICNRNVECWICHDSVWLANELGVQATVFQVNDPKGAFEAAMQITRDEKKEDEIAELVMRAPLPNWLSSDSFRDFYEQVRDMAQTSKCNIENLRDR